MSASIPFSYDSFWDFICVNDFDNFEEYWSNICRIFFYGKGEKKNNFIVDKDIEIFYMNREWCFYFLYYTLCYLYF